MKTASRHHASSGGTTVDKENIAPGATFNENVPAVMFVVPTPPAKLKIKPKLQEPAHALDLHANNNDTPQQNNNENNDNGNHTTELTSEEINERCKLLKLKIQRMREITASTANNSSSSSGNPVDRDNNTGNISSTNITDDLSIHVNTYNKRDAVDSTTIPSSLYSTQSVTGEQQQASSARTPLRALAIATSNQSAIPSQSALAATAGSTPFGLPPNLGQGAHAHPSKHSSHLPPGCLPDSNNNNKAQQSQQPAASQGHGTTTTTATATAKPQAEIPTNSSGLRTARRFGGQLAKPPVRVRHEEPATSSPVAEPQPAMVPQPSTPSPTPQTPSTPAADQPATSPTTTENEPAIKPARGILTVSAETVTTKKSAVIGEGSKPRRGDNGGASAVGFSLDIPPFNSSRNRSNTDTVLPATDGGLAAHKDQDSLYLEKDKAGADKPRHNTEYHKNNVGGSAAHINDTHNKVWAQRRASDEGVVPPASSSRPNYSPLTDAPPLYPSNSATPATADSKRQSHSEGDRGTTPSSAVQTKASPQSEGVEIKSIVAKKSQTEGPSAVSDRRVHFDDPEEHNKETGEERRGGEKRATPKRERSKKQEAEGRATDERKRQGIPDPKGGSPFKLDTIVVNGRPYVKLDLLGKGGSSQVYRVLSKNLHIYALKCVLLEASSIDNLAAEGYMNEISLLKKLNNHDNIIRLIDSEIRKGVIYLVLECAEIDLDMMIKRQIHQNTKKAEGDSRSPNLLPSGLGLNHVRLYWEQMLESVHTIHEERIVHGDLKPANFVCVQGKLKLIDFGIAKAIQNDTTNIVRENQVGTMNYISPEALTDVSTDTKQCMKLGRASDIWSLGCILYQMVYGRGPFAGITNLMKKVKAITDSKYKIEYPAFNNPLLLNVMQSCLERDARLRPTIPELLRHPFLL